MQHHKRYLITVFLIFICGIACRPSRNQLINQWETDNRTYKIRVSEYDEKRAFLVGAYYKFESAPMNSDFWQQIFIFRHDDRVGIPKENVHFVSERVGYMFMGWMCAITKDGGVSWSVWDAAKDLPDWQCCNYGLIQSISLEATGAGVMMLKPIPGRRGEVPLLLTNDYGQHWIVKQNHA